MKKAFSLALAVMAMLPLCAQFKLLSRVNTPVAEKVNPAFSKSLESVLLDFPYGFRNISGDLLLAQGEVEQYVSTISLPGAESCIIGRYHSVRDTTLSWQAVMFRDEDFQTAAKEYKSLFKQLKGSAVKVVDGSLLYLEGNLTAPLEEEDFTVTTLRFGISDPRYREFKVELEMLYKMPEWVININMISRKNDADVRPDWMTSGGR